VTDPGVAAAQRAGSALARARELSARLDDLRAGQPVEAFDSERAAQLAHRAVEYATDALRRAAAAHHKAAELHRQLADLLDSLGHHERAAEHRAYADLDDAAGDADEVGLALELPPGDMAPPAAPAVGH
jgi:hypothetical protein